MKARNKHESWCYTVTKTKARKKLKKLMNKRRRRDKPSSDQG